jgi:hypothetical protein
MQLLDMNYELRIVIFTMNKERVESCGRLVYIKMVAKFQSSRLFCSARSGRRLALPIRTEAAILLAVYQ